MKVFFYTTSLAVGGAEQQCCRTATTLKSMYGYNVEVIVTYPERSNERLSALLGEHSIPIHGCPWKSINGLLKLYRLFRSGGGDSVLFCYNTFPDFFGCVVGRLAGMKNIFTGIRSTYLPRIHIWMELFCQKFLAKKTIFNSFRARDEFIARHGFNPEKSVTISNSIPDTEYTHDYDKTPEAITVVTVGTFKPPKDYFTWLNTMALVHEKNEKIRGMIIGHGWQEPDIRRWIDSLGLASVVTIINGKDAQDIPKRLSEADIYFSSSIIEGTSNSIMEGLRAGLPVVVTDVGDNAYIVQDGESGYICPVGDCDALSAAILTLSKDADLRRSFGLRARERMKTHHGIAKIASEYNGLITGGAK